MKRFSVLLVTKKFSGLLGNTPSRMEKSTYRQTSENVQHLEPSGRGGNFDFD